MGHDAASCRHDEIRRLQGRIGRRDLARDATDPGWQDYCPNVTTLKALDAMPWLSRREW